MEQTGRKACGRLAEQGIIFCMRVSVSERFRYQNFMMMSHVFFGTSNGLGNNSRNSDTKVS